MALAAPGAEVVAPPGPDQTPAGKKSIPPVLIGGTALPIATAVFLAVMAPRFVWEIQLGERPILLFAVGMGIVSAAFLLWALQLARLRASDAPPRPTLWLILAVGLIARLIVIPGTPILEDDFYRYQWDGAVTAAGQNPFTHPPARFVTAPGIERLLAELKLSPTPPPPGYEQVAREGRQTLLRVNNPHIATIYPPLAQLGFAAGHLITPWQLLGWKLVVLAAEMITVALMIGALRAARQPTMLVALYWWHPLALKEFANSAHMDALLLPFMAGAVWMLIAARTRWMAIFLAAAAAVKFWPLLIVPTLMRRTRAAIMLGIAIGLLTLLLVLPQLQAVSANAGLSRFAADWQRNALVFPAIVAAFGFVSGDPARVARLLIAAIVIGWVARNWLQDRTEPIDRLRAAGTAILLLILLGPTGYPWYALWLAPFMVVQPRLPVLVLLAAAPAYYLDFWFQVRSQPDDWAWIAPLLSAGPVWLALALEQWRTRRA